MVCFYTNEKIKWRICGDSLLLFLGALADVWIVEQAQKDV